MLSDYTNEDDEYYYNPDIFDNHDRSLIMDDDSGITWGDVCDALTNLYNEHGHSGPFSLTQFHDALVHVVVDPALKSLIDKGLVYAYLGRDGKMMYALTELGQEVASYI